MLILKAAAASGFSRNWRRSVHIFQQLPSVNLIVTSSFANSAGNQQPFFPTLLPSGSVTLFVRGGKVIIALGHSPLLEFRLYTGRGNRYPSLILTHFSRLPLQGLLPEDFSAPEMHMIKRPTMSFQYSENSNCLFSVRRTASYTHQRGCLQSPYRQAHAQEQLFICAMSLKFNRPPLPLLW